jgi:DNA-binding LacI/PurR family transcriptional regulator
MPTTIKDIAKQAGVAHTTVSRALHNSPLISIKTTERIRNIAKELGYHPSVAARSLKTNRSQALGVIVSHIADPFFSEILQGIDDVAQQSGYSLFIAAALHDPERERAIVQTMREHRVDGVILCSTSFTPQQSQQLLSYNIPIVAINNQASEDYRFSIYHDDVDGGRQISRYLISLGHRRIAYLGDSLSGRTTQDRLAGFMHEMEAVGFSVPDEYIYQVQGSSAENGLAGIAHFLNIPERPSALICYNDMLAIGALKGLRQAGVQVPEQISVTGFDNILYSEYTQPPLTTIDQPKRYLGAEAARLLLELLNSSTNDDFTDQLKIQRLKGILLIRQSTAPPAYKSI